jgi:hypothetical protein
MPERPEPITLEFLGRQFKRFSDNVAELKSQFVVQVAILQRVDATATALSQRLDAVASSLSTEIGEVHNRLARIERRLRVMEEDRVS